MISLNRRPVKPLYSLWLAAEALSGVQSRGDVRYHPVHRSAMMGGTVHEVEQTKGSREYEVFFPVAVGGVFLVVLVVGALLG